MTADSNVNIFEVRDRDGLRIASRGYARINYPALHETEHKGNPNPLHIKGGTTMEVGQVDTKIPEILQSIYPFLYFWHISPSFLTFTTPYYHRLVHKSTLYTTAEAHLSVPRASRLWLPSITPLAQ